MASLIDLFKGSPYDVVKEDTETFIEQETTGLRRDSAVDVNNPEIYGSDALRIATKSTPSLSTMKQATQGELASGGLLGKGLGILSGGKIKSLDQARNKINGLLGIPQPLIPTRVAEQVVAGTPVNEVIDKNGTEFGKFLQQTGGGSAENIAKNALGNAIDILKTKATKILIGTPGEVGIVVPNGDEPEFVGANSDVTYTEFQQGFDYKSETSPEKLANDTVAKFKSDPDLRKFSPIYGTRSEESPYAPDRPYAGLAGEATEIVANSLEVKRGLTNKSDAINESGVVDEGTSKELEELQLIPFWIGKKGAGERIHFRTLISGLSETVTPSWNSSKFFGNPFSFHTYGGVERSVTFSLFMYCMSETELGKNWEKVERLTQYTYPTINQTDGLVQPPIIEFRLGDIYNKKVGLIDSLSYTFPDNGTWETDMDGFKLPKFIEVSISIKFIEQIGDEIALYKYGRSDAATDAMNDTSATINLDNVNVVGEASNNKFDSKGVKLTEPGVIKAPLLLNNGKKSITPAESTTTNPLQMIESSIEEEAQSIEELNRVLNRGNTPDNGLGRVFKDKNSKIKKALSFSSSKTLLG